MSSTREMKDCMPSCQCTIQRGHFLGPRNVKIERDSHISLELLEQLASEAVELARLLESARMEEDQRAGGWVAFGR
jgi:hypothetical protein